MQDLAEGRVALLARRWKRHVLRAGLRAALCLALCNWGAANTGWAQGKGTRAAAQKQKPRPCGGAVPCGKKKKSAQGRAEEARFAARVEEILSAENVSKAVWGILITDAATGDTLYERNAANYFAPASNMKLFTTALALATLGPEFRFTTTVEATSTLSPEGRVSGDVVLVGAGDPNLSSRKFPFAKMAERDGPPEKVLAQLADAVSERGVKQIDGDVIADDSFFSFERYPSGWEIDDMVWSYGAAVSAISVNDNTVTLTLTPGDQEGAAASTTVEPTTEDFQVENTVVTGPAGAKPDLTLIRDPGARRVILRGTLPLHGAPRPLVLAIEEPTEHAAKLLKRLLEARGVRINGTARARHWPEVAPPNSVRLTEHISPPLGDAVRVVNKMSENLHAEMLLRDAARTRDGAISLGDALKFAAAFYQSIGIDKTDVAAQDGSGLSRRDLVTPRAVVALLHYAAKQKRWAEAYEASLPISGEDGTLAERMKKTSAAGLIHAKTGTLDHVVALSGYATTLGGKRLVFSMFGNNFVGKNHDGAAVLDAICEAMVEELGKKPPASGQDHRAN